MFFNISNHPCHVEKSTWTDEQIQTAISMTDDERIVDWSFPAVTPDMNDEQLQVVANKVAKHISEMACLNGNHGHAAMVAGHYAMTIYLVAALQRYGIPCYIGDSVRVAEEQVQPDGTIAIVHRFQFAGFRKYPAIILV